MKLSMKRTLSLLLVLVMLVGLLPVVALADDVDQTPTTSGDDAGDSTSVTCTVSIVPYDAEGNSYTAANYRVTITGNANESIPYDANMSAIEAAGKLIYPNATSVKVDFLTSDGKNPAPTVFSSEWQNYTYYVYAKVTPSYTVTFNSDGGSTVASQTVEYKKTATEPAAPTKTGYDFVGWYNGEAEYKFTEAVTANITLTAKWKEAAHTHTMTHVEAKAATCSEPGNIEYWYCADCGKYFSDANGNTEITTGVTTSATGNHTLVSVARKEATCNTSGNIAHYKCSVCGKLFDKNTDDKKELKSSDVVIPATGKHTSSSWKVGRYPTEKRNGYMYKECTVCHTQLDYMVLTWRDVKPTLPFVDVDSKDSYYDAVCYVYEKGLMKGTSDTRFSPNRSFDRGMVAMILYRMEGRPSVKYTSVFPDVGKNDWYADCISWAYKNGVLKGYDDGTVRPEDPVTVEQLLTILYRYADSEGYDVSGRGSVNRYYDADDISNYALKAVRWAVSEDLISGRGYLGPKSSATRAEVAEILTNFCKNVLKYK